MEGVRTTNRRTGLAALSVLAATIAATGLGLPSAADAARPARTDRVGCAQPLLDGPQRAKAVAKNDADTFAQAAAANHRSRAQFRATAISDSTLWLDTCGKAFFVEPVDARQAAANVPAAENGPVLAQAVPATGNVPLADTFNLESRPGSARTLYLDFTGDQVTNTGWNQSYGATIDAAPYTIDGDTTTFSDAERTEIQKVWQIVAEDYAPFDVNVTTKDLGAAAIDRTAAADTAYGTRVIMSADPSGMQTKCGCGGIGYVNVFNDSSRHSYYQPAWVFTKGVGNGGKGIGEAAAHEAGHNFGLNHDGTSTSGYYSGAGDWAPIMGVGYYQPVSQWSKGEYPDANNSGQDDTAIIATGAPLLGDDVGDTSNPAALANGETRNGLIETRADADAFRFDASGTTTVTVTPGAFADLDAKLTIRNASGAVVAAVDPTSAKVSAETASGLDASWSAELPATVATYTATVDGVGTGDPLTAGLYSDYGSLGNYQISLTTNGISQPPATDPLTLTGNNPAAGTVGQAYSATPVTATGGTAPYTWSATGLPSGLTINAATATISGTPTAAGTSSVTVTAKDAKDTSANKVISLTVNPAPVAPVTVAKQSVSGKVGVAQSTKLVASGGNGTYTWVRTSGTLPAGLTLSSAGVLSGTPTASGTFTFAAKATSAGSSATGTITVTIAPKATTGGWTWTWSWLFG